MPPARAKPNALVASAKILTAERINQPKTSAWQEECWGHYDLQGELWFAALWLQNALSKMRLFAAVPPRAAGDEPVPIEGGPAVDLMEAFAGGVQGQGAVLSSMVVHLTVPGEGFLLGRTDDDETSWRVCSNDELKVTKNVWQLKIDQKTWETLPEESLPIRVWRPHARRAWLADSPTRHALGALREIQRCNEHIDATLVSRLAGAGLLIMPNEVSFPHTEASADKEDPFFYELLEAMTAPIKDRGVAGAVVPLPVRVPGDQVANFKHLTFATALDQKVLDLRTNAIERFATTVDFPSDILLGKGDLNHWCVDDETEILTEDGWRAYDELEVGDTVLTLNHETGLSEWQPVSDIYRAEVGQEPMLAMETANHSSLTTLNHRWPIVRNGRRWCRSEDLSNNCRILTAAPCVDQPTEAKWTDDLVELVAWTWTEGHVSKGKRPGIVLAQSPVVHPEYEARMRRCLTRLYGPGVPSLLRLGRAAWREETRSEFVDSRGTHHHEVTIFHLNADAAAPVVSVTPNKHVDLAFIRSLTPAQLELFIDVSLMGDGRHPTHRDITQRHASQLDAFDLAAILAGHALVRGTFPVGETIHHSTSLHQRSHVRPKKTGRTAVVEYTGTIWCPVTPNQTWLARRHGKTYYTGNTSWQISEEGLQMHIEPVTEMICDAFTRGYLKPGLATMGADSDAMIWYDSSELAVRPDRSADAKWMFADAIIGQHAAIRETGFTEADRPSEEEYREMVAWKLLGVRDMGPLALSLLNIDYDKSLIPQPGQAQSGELPGSSPVSETPVAGPDVPGPDTMPPPPISAPSNAPDLPSQAATLLVADQLVYRALERAGNRLRSLRKGKLTADQDCPPATMHECLGGIVENGNGKALKAADLLEGAWERVPEAAGALGEDPIKMQRALQRYVVGLLTTGQAHSVEKLAEFLADELPQSIASLAASGEGLQMGLVREMSRSMARLTETLAKQPPPVIQLAPPTAEVHLDGPVSVTHRPPPRSRRLERDADGNITKIVEED